MKTHAQIIHELFRRLRLRNEAIDNARRWVLIAIELIARGEAHRASGVLRQTEKSLDRTNSPAFVSQESEVRR